MHVGRYRIERILGRGGMGVVYEARDEQLDRTVALKVIAADLASDATFRERFRREAQLAAALDHPAVVTIYDLDEIDGRLIIAMRLLRGTDLGHVLGVTGTMDVGAVVRLLRPVASALDHAHRAGLVHRDVKPGNIFVGGARDGSEVYLLDFGLVRRIDARTKLTSAGEFMGTLQYTAPETVRNRPVDGRADQYALGCVAFELLAGRPPYHDHEGPAVLFAHAESPPPDLAEAGASAPPGVATAIVRALAKAPDDRFPTCTAFVDALAAGAALEPARSSERSDTLRADRTSVLAPESPPVAVPERSAPADPDDPPAVREGTRVLAAPAREATVVVSASGDASARSRPPALVAAIVAVLIAAGGGAALLATRGSGGPSSAASTAGNATTPTTASTATATTAPTTTAEPPGPPTKSASPAAGWAPRTGAELVRFAARPQDGVVRYRWSKQGITYRIVVRGSTLIVDVAHASGVDAREWVRYHGTKVERACYQARGGSLRCGTTAAAIGQTATGFSYLAADRTAYFLNLYKAKELAKVGSVGAVEIRDDKRTGFPSACASTGGSKAATICVQENGFVTESTVGSDRIVATAIRLDVTDGDLSQPGS